MKKLKLEITENISLREAVYQTLREALAREHRELAIEKRLEGEGEHVI